MRRVDFEARLVGDEGLRASLGNLQELARHAKDLEAQLTDVRKRMQKAILQLDADAVPRSLLAFYVGLTRPRISQIVKETT